MRAGRPVAGEALTLVPPGGGAPFIQIAHRRPSGVMSNDIVGNIARRLTAIVADDGTFELQDVAPGEYTAHWSLVGAPSAPRAVHVPEGIPEFPLRIDLGSASLAGTVRRSDGTPLSGAVHVRTAARNAQAVTGTDGNFSDTALDPGEVVVRALAREGSADAATVQLRDVAPPHSSTSASRQAMSSFRRRGGK